MVTTLSVDPGSYTSLTARLRTVSADTSERSLGSNPGALATASSSPVPTLSTMTVPATAPVVSIASARCCSAANWISRSMVSTTSAPGTAGSTMYAPCGMGTPYRSRSICWVPSVPVSWSSSASSRPSMPCSVSDMTMPTSCDPSSPAGYVLTGSVWKAKPVSSCSVMMRSASSATSADSALAT